MIKRCRHRYGTLHLSLLLRHEQSPNEGRRNSLQRESKDTRHTDEQDTIEPPLPRILTSSPPQKPPHRKPSCLAQTRSQCTRVSSYRPYAPLTIGGGSIINRLPRDMIPPPSALHQDSNPVNSPEHPRGHTTMTSTQVKASQTNAADE